MLEQDSIDWQELSNLYRIAPLGDQRADHVKLAFTNSRFKCFVFDSRSNHVAAARSCVRAPPMIA